MEYLNCPRCYRLTPVLDISETNGLCMSCNPSSAAPARQYEHTFRNMEELAEFFRVQAVKNDREATRLRNVGARQIDMRKLVAQAETERDTWFRAAEFLLKCKIES